MASVAALHTNMLETAGITTVTPARAVEPVAHVTVELLLGQALDDSPLLLGDGLGIRGFPVGVTVVALATAFLA